MTTTKIHDFICHVKSELDHLTPSGHTAFMHRHIDVDATSRRCIDVASTSCAWAAIRLSHNPFLEYKRPMQNVEIALIHNLIQARMCTD